MKKSILAILLIFSLQMYCQEKVITTEEEYNYLTKGYAQDLKTGHDIKSGYTLEKFYDRKIDEFNFEYYYYNEIATKKTKAILVISTKEKKGKVDKIFYDCIPFNNAELNRRSAEEPFKGMTMSIAYNSVFYELFTKSIDLLKNNPSGKI